MPIYSALLLEPSRTSIPYSRSFFLPIARRRRRCSPPQHTIHRTQQRNYPCTCQAGSLCKDLGNENLAFVLLNRYVDLTEAIEEGNASVLDNSDFAEATNVPLVDDRTLPAKQV